MPPIENPPSRAGLSPIAVALAVTLTTAVAPVPADPLPAGDIAEGMSLAATTDYMPTFGKAVGAAGLGDVLAGPGPFTVFAPTEAAFARLPAGMLDELLRPENRDRLRGLLLGHVVAGNLPVAGLGNGLRLQTLDGGSLEVAADADGLTVNKARVTSVDVATRNGVIHFIDRVLLPTGPLSTG